ncbi:hypothetical protein GCK32_012052 [Trichostrongylus colubriformis]|uniref:Uncharacterized protein n=1 Tax=Trichostrongylus colubriformis TaxID=6319 RepID=A0AAN8F669_TRICO
MRILTSTGHIILVVIGLHVQITISAEVPLSTSDNGIGIQKTSLEGDEESSVNPGEVERRGEQSVSPDFVRNLNEVLMKFLREVTEMVKKSPRDAEHLEQTDVERIITNSLKAAVPEQVTTGPSTLSESPTAQATGLRLYRPRTVQNRALPDPSDQLTTSNNSDSNLENGRASENSRHVVRSQESMSSEQNSISKNVDSSDDETVARNGGKERIWKPFSNNRAHAPRSISRKKPEVQPNQKNSFYSTFSLPALGRGQIRVEPTNVQEKRFAEGITSDLKPRKVVKQPFARTKAQIQVSPAVRPHKRYGEARPWRTLTRGNFRGPQATNAHPQQSRTRATRPKNGRTILQDRRSTDFSETISQARQALPVKKRFPPVNRSMQVRRVKTTGEWNSGFLRPSPTPRAIQRPSTIPRRHVSQHGNVRSNTDQVKTARATTPSSAHTTRAPRRPSPPKLSKPSKDTATSSTSSVATDGAVGQHRNDSSPRENILNNMLFDVFNRMGVQSFVMNSESGSLHGVADPSRTRFVPDHVDDESRTDRQSSQSASQKRLHEFEDDELSVVVSDAQRKSSNASRSKRPNFAGQRLAVRNPVFFREREGGMWKKTAGVTGRELGAAAVKKS